MYRRCVAFIKTGIRGYGRRFTELRVNFTENRGGGGEGCIVEDPDIFERDLLNIEEKIKKKRKYWPDTNR